MKNIKGRLDYIDVAKGLGMLTIVWGHISGGVSHTVFYAFHIPFFFFLSGLVFQRERYASIGLFVKRRIKSLLFPYVVFSVLTWMMWVSYSYLSHAMVSSYWMPLFQTFIAQGSESFLVHNVPLWFVSCLFVMEVIYYFSSSLSGSMNMMICILLGVIGTWMSVTDFFDFSILPWSFDVALMGIPFYAAGNLLAQHPGHLKLTTWVRHYSIYAVGIVIVMVCLLCIGALSNGHVSMGHARLGYRPIVFYLTAFCGIIGFLFLSILLCHFPLTVVLDKIKWLGRNSFRLMAIHNPIKGIIIVIISRSISTPPTGISESLIYSMTTFVLTIAVSVILIKAISMGLQLTLSRDTLLPS